jgi:hypothetical protein
MRTQDHTGDVPDPAYERELAAVGGYPDTLVTDLSRATAPEADRVELRWRLDEDTGEHHVTIRAADGAAAKWLYDWFEDSETHYRTEYVDASAEHKAAAELASAWYDEVSG